MAIKSHLNALTQGPEAWARWRKDGPNKPDLTDSVIENQDLRGADLSGTDFCDSRISNTILRESNLQSAFLCNVSFPNCDLSGADLSDADLARANLNGANLPGAKMRRAHLNSTTLENANVSNAALDSANLEKAKLSGAVLAGTNLANAQLVEAELVRTNLSGADLSGAKLTDANLADANLTDANLNGADLAGADLSGANLTRTDFSGAILSRSNLTRASLISANLSDANLRGAHVFGISAWDIRLRGAEQTGLVITPENEPAVMVDDIEVAQFIYLLLNRKKIRNIIDAVTQRGVLLLGRFGDGGLDLLQGIAGWLRQPDNGGYLPLLFDFPRPTSKTYTETVRTLAGLARFVIVDLSGPSVPQEITATVDLHEIPFVPILSNDHRDWSMFADFLAKERVIEPIRFADQDHLIELLPEEVITPAEKLIEKRQKRLDQIFRRVDE